MNYKISKLRWGFCLTLLVINIAKEENVDSRVLEKYDVTQKLGRGAYGIVWKAVDKKSKEVLAVKKCYDAFRNSVDAQRMFREVLYLLELRDHPNIVQLRDVLRTDNKLDVYLLFEYVESDLHSVIKANILEPIHEQYITYQLFCALKYIHSAQIVHRDIKPANIIINSGCQLKLCDFGLCRSIAHESGRRRWWRWRRGERQKEEGKKSALTDYLATRWYRAPEVLLGSTEYSTSFDVWAVGCVLGEIIARKPIFPGSSTMNQLECILKVTGCPTPEDIKAMKTQSEKESKSMIDQILKDDTKGLEVEAKGAAEILEAIGEALPLASPEASDLLRLCLMLNPSERIVAQDGLRHPYVIQFYDGNEPSCNHAIDIAINDYKRLSVEEYREKLYSEVQRWKDKDQAARELEEAKRHRREPAEERRRDSSRGPSKGRGYIRGQQPAAVRSRSVGPSPGVGAELSASELHVKCVEYNLPVLLAWAFFMLALIGIEKLRRFGKHLQELQVPGSHEPMMR